MKILKPGKVEQRKFVCPQCGCVFLATCTETEALVYMRCPQDGCRYGGIEWADSEPYEEPTPTQTDRERLQAIIHNTYLSCDTINHHTAAEIADELIAHGVTFREGT